MQKHIETGRTRSRMTTLTGLSVLGLLFWTVAPTHGDTPAGAVDVPENAPVLMEVYPTLTSGALQYARLVDLPQNVLLKADGFSVSTAEIEKDMAQVPAEMREQLRQNAFFMLEQTATRGLLLQLARQHVKDAESLDENELLQVYVQDITRSINVSDAEIKAFYDENKNLVGNAPLDQIKDRISDHLRQEKQQQMIQERIANLGREIKVAVSAPWVREQAAYAQNNPVDKARASGKPTFVNFGAKGCRPCDMMAPIREELEKEYEGQVNVVYVHVNEQQILASRYGVRGIPHLIFFDKSGKQIHMHTGFMPKEQIEEWLKKSGADDA